MTNNEMNLLIAELAAKCSVTQEDARAALEAGNWNKLTAGQILEDEKLRRAREIEEVVSSCETAAAQAAAAEKAEAAEEPGATTAKAEEAGNAESRNHRGSKGLKNLGDSIRRLVACGNRNRFVVRRNDAALLDFPVTVMVVLMLFAFWTCIPLLAIGLFLGCRYSFIGQDADRAAEYIKKTVAGT